MLVVFIFARTITVNIKVLKRYSNCFFRAVYLRTVSWWHTLTRAAALILISLVTTCSLTHSRTMAQVIVLLVPGALWTVGNRLMVFAGFLAAFFSPFTGSGAGSAGG